MDYPTSRLLADDVARHLDLQVVLKRFPATLELATDAMLLTLAVSLPSGIAAALIRPVLAEIRNRCFPKDPPASTFVVISSLAEAGYLVEVEAVAVLD